MIIILRAISTVVAHFLHTEGVTGSNPVSPIRFYPGFIGILRKYRLGMVGVNWGNLELKLGYNWAT